MKKFIIAAALAGLLPSISLAGQFMEPMDGTCNLNQVCTFKIHGLFNKIIHTYGIEAKQQYICKVLSNNGNYFNIHNVQASPGVRFQDGDDFSSPFYIYGPDQGTGSITYTLHNNNDDVLKARQIEYVCDLTA